MSNKRPALDELGFDEISDYDNHDNYDDEIPAKDHNLLIQKITGKNDRKKRKVNEDVNEGEFAVAPKQKLSMAMMMEEMGDEGNEELTHRIEKFGNNAGKYVENVALGKTEKDKYIREAQMKQTRKELKGWQPTVEKLKSSTQLTFPLPMQKPLFEAEPKNIVKPKTELELEIEKAFEGINKKNEEILEEGKLLARRIITEAEIRQQTQQYAKMKHILHYKELKLSKQNKIKSKNYRRIARKQKEKQKLTIEELKELDPETAQSEIDRREKRRIEERMTLKHKTTGKWAVGARQTSNPHLKKALHDQLKLGAELQKKINQISEETDSDDEESEEEEQPELSHAKGLMSMKFMQRGLERDKQQYEDLKSQMREEDEQMANRLTNQIATGESQTPVEQKLEKSVSATKTGKQSFDGNAQVSKIHQDASITLNGQMLELKPTASFLSTSKATTINSKNNNNNNHNNHDKNNIKEEEDEEDDEEIEIQKEERRNTRSGQNAIEVDDNDNDNDNDDNDNGDMKFSAELETPIVLNKTKLDSIIPKLSENGKTVRKEKKETNSGEVEAHQEFKLGRGKKNEKMISRAFANDDMEIDFQKQKDKDLDSMLPEEEESNAIPGWGNWAGEGFEQNPKPTRAQLARKAATKKEREKLKERLREERRDKNLKHVIINEDAIKQLPTKYYAQQLPMGFTKDNYQRSISMPVSSEYNSLTAHVELTRPKVNIKVGEVINPIAKKVVVKKSKKNSADGKK